MGLFSVRENVRRTVNVINVPKHDIWKLRTFEEAKDFLVKTFPQIDFSTFVSDEEIARFAALPGKQLPKPQYVKSAQQIFKNSNKGKNNSKKYNKFDLEYESSKFTFNQV